MSRVELTSVADGDGVLTLTVPLGKSEANRQVRVTVEPLARVTESSLSAEQWRRSVRELAGSITDPTFRRHDQGEFENRDELFP